MNERKVRSRRALHCLCSCAWRYPTYLALKCTCEWTNPNRSDEYLSWALVHKGTGVHKHSIARIYRATSSTARGDLQSCWVLRIPHWSDNRLKDGGKVLSLTHRPQSSPQQFVVVVVVVVVVSGTHFCQRLDKSKDLVRLEGLGRS
jgi:hypothetical protein